MLGLGWSEIMVLAVVALIVVGPKDLPMLLRNLGRMMGSVRRMSNEFRREIDKAIAMDEVKEAKKALSDPLKQTHSEISREFNTMRGGKTVPSGKIKPSDPNTESVAETLRERAGIAPKTSPEAAAGTTVVAGASGAATPSKAEEGSEDARFSHDQGVTKAKPRAPAPRAPTTAKPAPAKPSAKTPAAKKSVAKKATGTKSTAGKKTTSKSSEAGGAAKPAAARKRAAPKKTVRSAATDNNPAADSSTESKIAENQGGDR
ncbi:Sec-independent protein translocase protein TatB [Pelagibacterium montanilacus]|uniref:Sec-independent protein translocase protein TatB n=1 Tax=Pelagibacterium montanilacus TaxID=2185280 RepID=UPI000F8F2B07|nr:Sec-independent protein translocase protein TatB [Pelagibacterium montanilacus]